MNDYLEKLKGFILSPKQAFEKEKDAGLNSAFRFILPLIIFSLIAVNTVKIIFFSIYPSDLVPINIFTVTFGLVSGFISSIIILFLSGAYFHIWLYIVGAKEGIEKTLEVTIYSYIPFLLLGWILILGIFLIETNPLLAIIILFAIILILIVWDLYLTVIGLKIYQKMKSSKIALAIILSIIIPVIIILFLVVFAIGLFAVAGI